MGGKRSKRNGKQNREKTQGAKGSIPATAPVVTAETAGESPPPATLAIVEAIVEAVAAPLLEPPEPAPPHEGANGSASARESPDAASAPDTVRMEPYEAMPEGSEEIGAETKREREHRNHPRVSLAVDIDLASESHFFSGLSGDVSEGGLFVQTYRSIEVGSEVALEFELPDGHVRAHGRVCWHRDKSDSAPPGVGIAFDDLSEEDRAIIHRFCERREPLYYDLDHG